MVEREGELKSISGPRDMPLRRYKPRESSQRVRIYSVVTLKETFQIVGLIRSHYRKAILFLSKLKPTHPLLRSGINYLQKSMPMKLLKFLWLRGWIERVYAYSGMNRMVPSSKGGWIV